jgi:excisionase family DNA binding protein
LTKRARSSLYEDIAAGRIQTVKLGTSTRIPRVELERYISERLTGHDPDPHD